MGTSARQDRSTVCARFFCASCRLASPCALMVDGGSSGITWSTWTVAPYHAAIRTANSSARAEYSEKSIGHRMRLISIMMFRKSVEQQPCRRAQRDCWRSSQNASPAREISRCIAHFPALASPPLCSRRAFLAACRWHSWCTRSGHWRNTVTQTPLVLNFADARGRRHLVEASVERDVWTLRTSIDGRPFTRECHSWQAVERTLTWLRRHAPESVDGGAPSSRVTGPIAAAIGAVMVLLSGAAAVAQPQYPESDEVRQFVAATRDYAWMHRRIESAMGPLEVNADITRIHHAVVQFAD